LKNVKFLFTLIALGTCCARAPLQESGFWGGLEAGPFQPGFRLIETSDATRSFPPDDGPGPVARPLRIYVWYPAKPSANRPMRLDDYIALALDDFHTPLLPVPLSKGLDPSALEKLRESPVGAVRGAAPEPARFPVLVLGQGLYYESPLCHFVLCEFLASHGYVVATSPLVGTRYRLVNITVEDVETEVRDMESVLAAARELPFVDPAALGAVGYDLGGMAGLILAMRHPEIRAYLSFDSAILDKHYTGLPLTHPQYREERFRIPWMHMMQARFIRTVESRAEAPSLFERKAFGPSYLVHVPTTSHGGFSSYAVLGIDRAVPGYWGSPAADQRSVYEGICQAGLAFLDRYIKNDRTRLDELVRDAAPAGADGPPFRIERKDGPAGPPSEAELVDLIIKMGMREAGPVIDGARAAFPGVTLIDESVLNWLGAHFLYWWGRGEEAIAVFELNVSLYPGSWNAHDSLGEAYAALGRKEEAIRSYERSLELNPDNGNARSVLERLAPPGKKAPGAAGNGAGPGRA
jgi:pimeloyl-ACP methyl ester carboxylesterase